MARTKAFDDLTVDKLPGILRDVYQLAGNNSQEVVRLKARLDRVERTLDDVVNALNKLLADGAKRR